MISIIICSVNKSFAQQVEQNIAATIGTAWELIAIDNTISPKGITSVYNEGAAKAKYDLLCFAHEDILFETPGWGKKLVSLFENDPAIGLAGVAGSKYKSKVVSGWYTGVHSLDCGNIKHYNRHGITETLYFNPDPAKRVQQTVTIDGVFIACPRKVWQQIPFDEKLLTGFHLYDLDFSLRVSQHYKSVVTYEIDILHITKGNHFDNRWLEHTLRWHKESGIVLPRSTGENNLAGKEADKRIVKTWLIRLKHERISLRNKFRWLVAVNIWKYPAAWINVPLFLLKRYFSSGDKPALGQ